MSVKLLYFAWVRERVGRAEEIVDPPADVATVADLMAWLASRGEEYALAFESAKFIRVAIDQAHVRANAPVAGAKEVAFFPPMTGG
jgi:molybdopterin synthase sulfur carrier subunit